MAAVTSSPTTVGTVRSDGDSGTVREGLPPGPNEVDAWVVDHSDEAYRTVVERLLEEIREIRLSERRFYQKITDIYSTAMDYDRDSPITQAFFAKVQNKMHYAVHSHTAAAPAKAPARFTTLPRPPIAPTATWPKSLRKIPAIATV